MTEYWLQIIYLSNERPWRNEKYTCYPMPGSDAGALDWARGMQNGLGMDYQVTLFKDGKVLPYNGETKS